MSSILSIRDSSKKYKVKDKEITALDDVSLDIYPGEIIAIIGPSGSGKSTLLQILGLLDRPTTGDIVIDGVHTSVLNDHKLSQLRNSSIGFVFQFFHLQPDLNVADNIAVPAMFAGIKPDEIQSRTHRLLDQVGLADKAASLPRELSGGQTQRVAIARALICQPKIILADEPTGNLDPASADEIMNLFYKINHEYGTTIIIVTHNVDIMRHTTRTLTLENGILKS